MFVRRLPVAVLFVLLLCTCARQAAPPDPVVNPIAPGGGSTTRAGGPCAGGPPKEHDRNAPIVCVDDTGSTLRVSPDPVVVHDVGRVTGAPVTVQWFTHTGTGNLQLEIDPGCVTDLRCNGRGHCTARTRDIDAKVKCKYDVWTETHPRLDPEIEIDPCC